MKVNNLVLLAALCGGAYYLLKGYADRIIGNIEQQFGNIKWLGIKGGAGNFSVTYRITNKNPETLTVFGFQGNLTWRNTDLATIATQKDNPVVLTTGVQKEFTMYFYVPLVDLVGDLTLLLFGKKPPEGSNKDGFYVKGNLDAGLNSIRGSIPFSQHLTLADYGL
jgi:hypothetical protein